MKRFAIVLFGLIITLSGCSVKQAHSFECVADSYEEIAAPSFYIDAAMPCNAFLTDSCDDGCCAVFSHEDYEIYQQIFPAQGLDDACTYLTGRDFAALRAIQTQSFPTEEYRFAYTCACEEGTLSCSGKFFYDGQFCYAVMILCPIQKEPIYHEDFSEVLSLAELKSV